jgi:antitoxin VapB
MSILVRNAKTERKIRRLARRTGETMTTAIDRAVDERLAKLGPERRRKGRLERNKVAEILTYFDSLPVDDPRSPDEIIGYDEYGIPK